jgi:hypothetical protein
LLNNVTIAQVFFGHESEEKAAKVKQVSEKPEIKSWHVK